MISRIIMILAVLVVAVVPAVARAVEDEGDEETTMKSCLQKNNVVVARQCCRELNNAVEKRRCLTAAPYWARKVVKGWAAECFLDDDDNVVAEDAAVSCCASHLGTPCRLVSKILVQAGIMKRAKQAVEIEAEYNVQQDEVRAGAAAAARRAAKARAAAAAAREKRLVKIEKGLGGKAEKGELDELKSDNDDEHAELDQKAAKAAAVAAKAGQEARKANKLARLAIVGANDALDAVGGAVEGIEELERTKQDRLRFGAAAGILGNFTGPHYMGTLSLSVPLHGNLVFTGQGGIGGVTGITVEGGLSAFFKLTLDYGTGWKMKAGMLGLWDVKGSMGGEISRDLGLTIGPAYERGYFAAELFLAPGWRYDVDGNKFGFSGGLLVGFRLPK